MEVIHTIGRRKTSVARIFISEGKGAMTVNKKDAENVESYRLSVRNLTTNQNESFETTGTSL